MRRSFAVFVAVLLFGHLAAGGAVVTATHAGPVTLDGTVTGVDGAPAGDAVVLVGEDSTLMAFSPAELRAFATDPPRNLTVIEVGSDGRFEATVDASRAEAAVAVSDAGISDLVYVRGESATLSLRLYERRPQTVHAHLGAVAADERRAELYVNLVNSGDTAVQNLSVRVGPLPEGWTVASVTTDGRYDPENRTLTWSSVAPGAEVDTTVLLAVPADAAVGEYRVGLHATSDTHRVDVDPETAEVLPEETETPTRMPTRSADSRASPTDASPTTRSSGPGFGVVAVVAALASLAMLGRRR